MPRQTKIEHSKILIKGFRNLRKPFMFFYIWFELSRYRRGKVRTERQTIPVEDNNDAEWGRKNGKPCGLPVMVRVGFQFQ